MKTFNFACGGVSSDPVQADGGNQIRLDVQGELKNVNLKIEDISKAMVSNIPNVLLDLLEVAAYVYCADQQSPRGSEKLTDHGRDWRRAMHFTIPLREPSLWESDAVKDALCQTLGFLSDDSYTFSFVQAEKPLAEKEMYFPDLIEGTFVPDDVALFSGGVDSFAGAVTDLVENDKKMVLVGHHSASKVFGVQKELIDGLKRGGLASQVFYVPVNVTNTGITASEYTQRTRSFLFACLGLVVARMFKKDEFTFYENGVVSLNIPIAKDVLGARATRTTHPKVIRGFEELFSALLDRDIEGKTPFQWLTKKEVTQKISENGYGNLLAKTNSCTRPRTWTKQKRHCGACSQCIDRRFAILAAGLEELDPGEQYKLDLLLGDRSLDRDIRMALAYVKFFQTFASSTKSGFISANPQITSALAYFSGLSTDEARDRIYELYQRHSRDVVAVIEDGLARHKGDLAQGDGVPAGALLSMCLNRSQVKTPPPSDYDQQVKSFMDGLEGQACEFAVDADAEKILFKGEFVLEGTNFKLFNALLENHRAGKKNGNEVAFVRAPDLADVLGVDEPSLRQQVGRLRKSVNERLAIDLGIVFGTDDFIENRQGKGYRLSPSLREILKADLQPPN